MYNIIPTPRGGASLSEAPKTNYPPSHIRLEYINEMLCTCFKYNCINMLTVLIYLLMVYVKSIDKRP